MKHALDLPFNALEDLKKRYKLTPLKGGVTLYSGSPLLPEELRPYASQDYSYSRWLEDEQNALVLPPRKASLTYTLSPAQEEAAVALAAAYGDQGPGFLLADERGCGKTLSVIAGITKAAETAGFGATGRAKVLVIATPNKVEAWREELSHYPKAAAYSRFLVIAQGQMKRLLTAPPNARLAATPSVKARQTATKGTSTVPWDFVILDDYLSLGAYPQSRLALEAAALAQVERSYQRGRTPFVIYTTPGQELDPLSYTLASKLISRALTTTQREVPPKEWGAFLQRNGFQVSEQRGRLFWGRGAGGEATSQAKDRALLKQALASSSEVLSRSLTPPGGEKAITYLPLPLTLTRGRLEGLLRSWASFKKDYSKKPTVSNTVPLLSLFSTTEAVKEQEVVGHITSWVKAGECIYLRVHSPKVAKEYYDKLLKRKVAVELLLGKTAKEEAELWPLFRAHHVEVLVACAPPTTLAQDTKKAKTLFTPLVVVPNPFQEDLHNELKMLFKAARHPKVYLPYTTRSYEEEAVRAVIEYSTQVLRMSHGKMLSLGLQAMKTLVVRNYPGVS